LAVAVRLVVIPRSDADLNVDAEACLRDGAISPDRLAECLRAAYPRIAVHDGVEANGARIWYVYREGHWIAE
jgi:hypothetical protein